MFSQDDHTKLLAEHKNTCDLLKAANADNKVLVSQHRNAIERERLALTDKLAEQDRILEDAKQNILQELEKEKEEKRVVDHERYSRNYFLGKMYSSVNEIRKKTTVKAALYCSQPLLSVKLHSSYSND